VRLLTNPGSNLRPEILAAYDVTLAAQSIVVDGTPYDTRSPIPLGLVDEWVRSAKIHPYVVGTTAAETVEACREIAKEDKDILLVTTSRRIIGSHAAATTAARLLESQPATRNIAVSVVDSGVTDAATGLVVILAGECRRAGLDLGRTTKIVETFAASLQLSVVPRTLDYLVSGGRAGILRAKVAEWLDRVPMLAFTDGQLGSVGLVSAKKTPDGEMVERLVARLGKGRRVWAAIGHGAAPEVIAPLARELRSKLDVAFLYALPLSPSIYLHVGPGARFVAAGAIDDLGWTPKTPAFPSA